MNPKQITPREAYDNHGLDFDTEHDLLLVPCRVDGAEGNAFIACERTDTAGQRKHDTLAVLIDWYPDELVYCWATLTLRMTCFGEEDALLPAKVRAAGLALLMGMLQANDGKLDPLLLKAHGFQVEHDNFTPGWSP